MSDPGQRRRWVSLGELIALAALVVSALGVWIAWKGASHDGPTRVVEQRAAIPLTLRATAERDGKSLVIQPVEPSHALESLIVKLPSGKSISLGSDGELDADVVERALDAKDKPKGAQSLRVTIDARYVEAGADRRRSVGYVLRYRWEGGGLFDSRSLRLIGLSRG